jgi:hypothetical protein
VGIGAAIVTAVAGAQAAASVIGTIAAVAIEAAVAVGAQVLGQKLQGRPDAQSRPGRSGNVRSGSMAHQVIYGQSRKGGLIAYANGSGAQGNNKFLYLIVVYAAHEVEEFGDFYINGELVTVDPVTNSADGRFENYAFFEFVSGTDTQVALPAAVEDTADPALWGENHRLRGRAYVYAKLKESPARFPSFIPTLTCTIKGKNNIYDPRDQTLKWTDNPALIAANILEDYVNIPRSRIDSATLIASANDCDTVVNKVGGTEKKYRAGGFIDLEGEPEDWLDPVVKCMAGAVIEHDGIYYVHSGYYTAPEVTITDDHIVGDIIRTTARTSLERATVIKGIFVAPETFDAATEYPIIRDANTGGTYEMQTESDVDVLLEGGNPFLAEERSPSTEVVMEHDLEFVASHTQAQRVAKIALQTQLLDEQVTCDVNLLVGLDVKPWDAVTLNSDALGINGIYKVIEHSFVTNNASAHVKLTLRKHASSIYDWDHSTEEQTFDTSNGPSVNDSEGDKWTSGNGAPSPFREGDPGERYVDIDTGDVWKRGPFG